MNQHKQAQYRSGLPEKYMTTETIIDSVCQGLNVRKEDVISKSRKREYSEARSIAIGLILQSSIRISLTALGEIFGGRDHSTIIYNRQLFSDLMESDRGYQNKVNRINAIKYMTDFEILVKQMREAQKEYDRTKSSIALKLKWKLEKSVDEYIKTILTNTSQTLF